MYRHLLVPIDNSDLSTITIGRDVEFALTLGASRNGITATSCEIWFVTESRNSDAVALNVSIA